MNNSIWNQDKILLLRKRKLYECNQRFKKRRTQMVHYRADLIRKQDRHIDPIDILKMLEAYE